MNQTLFNKLMGRKYKPYQRPSEWELFLEFCDMYLKKHGIKNPVVVELGTGTNKQKPFYKQLFGAEHIGINITEKKSKPDILGDTHDSETMKALKEKLGGRPINILFIDASHYYENVKKDYELYSPLCSDIVAFHDIELGRYAKKKRGKVWKLWDELRMVGGLGDTKGNEWVFLSIHQYQDVPDRRKMGIGVMIKK